MSEVAEKLDMAVDMMTEGIIEIQHGIYAHCALLCDMVAAKYEQEPWNERIAAKVSAAKECAKEIREASGGVKDETMRIRKEMLGEEPFP